MLQIKDVTKVFNPGTVNEKLALDHFSLTLENGDFVTIIGGNGAGKVHTESADVILSGMVIPEYYKGGTHTGENIVIPIVGKKPRAAREYLKGLKEAGYTVHLSFNDVSPLNSAKRATTRYIETGRFLNPSYIQEIGIQPQETYDTLKKEGGFDTYSKYDNNVKFGQPAKKVERLDGNGNKINWEDWQ